MSSSFTLTLPSEPRMLSVARSFVESVCQSFHLENRITQAIVLATGEAVTNVFRHAHRNRPTAQLKIQIQVDSARAVITVHDEGDPFDINQVPHMEPGELRLGGRGVFMMRRLMDELSCQRRGNDRGNILRMVKHCPTKTAIRGVG